MKPADILDDGSETYQNKNDDYGDAWRLFGQIMMLMADGEPVTIETPEDWIAIEMYVYHINKLQRAFHGEFIDDDPNFESIQDSIEDEMVYSAMHASNQASRSQQTDGGHPPIGYDHPTTTVCGGARDDGSDSGGD